MIQLKDHAEGCILPVRVQPGARRQGIVGEQNGALKVAVTAAPEKGKANDAVQALLCSALNLRKSQVELLGGATSRDKRYLLRGLATAEVSVRIHALGVGNLG